MHRLLMLLLAGLLALAACADDAEEEVAETDDADAAEEEADEDHDDMADDDYDLADQPDDAAAMFVSPADGDTVSSPFEVELAAEGITLAPAGDPVIGEGHMHVVADVSEYGCFDDGEVVPGPSDAAEEEGIFHLGDGSDRREIELEPGTYELCVQLADGPHRAFGQTEVIEVTVE